MKTLILLSLLALVSCEEMTTYIILQPETFVDFRDGREYKTVEIGDQIWMAENLDYINYDYYPDTIDFSTLHEKPDFPMYFNNGHYGVLYNWYAAINAAPKGWHLPTELEWAELIDFAGGDSIAGIYLKYKDGFNALPGGMKSDEFFHTKGTLGEWWGFGLNDEQWGYIIYFTGDSQMIKEDLSSRKAYAKFLSIRCIKDY